MELQRLSPEARPAAVVALAAGPSLWSQAPGFRRLVLASGALATLSGASWVALPHFASAPDAAPPLAAPQAASCSLIAPLDGQRFVGKAQGPVDDLSVRRAVANVELSANGKMSPEYVGKPRELIVIPWGTGSLRTFAVLPAGVAVFPGDTVEVVGRHRDPAKPCNFIPWTLTRVVASGR